MRKLIALAAACFGVIAGAFAAQAVAYASPYQCRWVTANGPGTFWAFTGANQGIFYPTAVDVTNAAGAGGTPNVWVRVADAGGHPYPNCTWGPFALWRGTPADLYGCWHNGSSYGYPLNTDTIQIAFSTNNSYAYQICGFTYQG